MDWKTQNPTFQVLYSVIPRDERPPPLQIRSFTSDSYEAIKKRERKKSDRREQNNTEQRSSAWKKKDTGASAGAAVMQEVTRMDSGLHDVISATRLGGSKTAPLVIQDGGRVEGGDKLQHRLCSSSPAPISPSEDASSSDIQCPTVPASPTMSPKAVPSGSGAEQELEIFRNGIQRTASLDDVHMVPVGCDDAGNFDQQPHAWTRNDTEAAVESSYPTPTESNAGGRFDPREQLIESCGTRSPRLVSLELKSAPVAAAATGLEWLSSIHVDDGALAEVLPDETSHAVGVARSIGSLARRARSERASLEDCKYTPPSVWTSEQDEQLLHLRDIAQLNWGNIVGYLPGMTVDAIKGRYKHLNRSRVTCQIVSAKVKPRVQMRQRTTHLAPSALQKAAKECRALSRTELRKQPMSILSKHRGTPPCRRVTKRAKPTKRVASLVGATHEDVCERTSRCGRPIRHPFRHRPSDGYV